MRPETKRIGLLSLLWLAGCAPWGDRQGGSGAERPSRRSSGPPIRRVVCLFDHRPWLNADAAGDRDPEGVQYRVFLDCDTGRGVLREGKFHVDMYRIRREPNGEVTRELVSDWHYPTSQFNTVSAKILGKGYHIQLTWNKSLDVGGHEVEFVTRYEDPDGHSVRAGTVRKRVPRYDS